MRALLTGGSGRLGTALRTCTKIDWVAPTSRECDITRNGAVEDFLLASRPDVVVHSAAFTKVSAAEEERQKCFIVNVIGTQNVAMACGSHRCGLVHISTDYVFAGDRGQYKEDDPTGPPINWYSFTKISAEEMVRLYARKAVIIRTSFRDKWTHPSAFVDVFTSQDYLDVIAPEILLAIQHWSDLWVYDAIHIGTERKTLYELAIRRAPGVQAAHRHEAGVRMPADVSLDCSRWRGLKKYWGC